eukprot:2341464-Rhodomonas_salina.2
MPLARAGLTFSERLRAGMWRFKDCGMCDARRAVRYGHASSVWCYGRATQDPVLTRRIMLRRYGTESVPARYALSGTDSATQRPTLQSHTPTLQSHITHCKVTLLCKVTPRATEETHGEIKPELLST